MICYKPKFTFFFLIVYSLNFCEPSFVLTPGAKFYESRLLSLSDCHSFLNSNSNAARSFLFINSKSPERFFIDPKFTASLTSCLFSATDNAQVRFVITEFRGVQHFDEETWQVFKNLSYTTREWVNLMPHFNVLLGPGGDPKDVFPKQPIQTFLDLWIVVSCSESEDIKTAYPKDFIIQLEKTILPFARGSNRMLQLNGFHLANMEKSFDWKGLKKFGAIIIHTHRLLTKERVESKIPKESRDLIIYDTELFYSESSSLPGIHLLVYIVIVWIVNKYFWSQFTLD